MQALSVKNLAAAETTITADKTLMVETTGHKAATATDQLVTVMVLAHNEKAAVAIGQLVMHQLTEITIIGTLKNATKFFIN